MTKHGQISTEENWTHCRWCEVCKAHHGILYACPHYDIKTLGEIRKLTKEVLKLGEIKKC